MLESDLVRSLAKLLRPRLRCRHRRMCRQLTIWSLVKALILWSVSLLIRVKVRAKGKVALPLKQGFIVAANHLNGADSFVLQIGLRTRLFFLTSAKWFAGRFSRFFMSHVCDSVPVLTGNPMTSLPGLRRCIETLRQGGSVGVFPEGNWNAGGRVDAINDGAAYLAARTSRPVLPVIVRNLRTNVVVDETSLRRECWTGFLSLADNLLNTDVQLLVGEPVLPMPGQPHNPELLRHEVARINAELRRQFDALSEPVQAA